MSGPFVTVVPVVPVVPSVPFLPFVLLGLAVLAGLLPAPRVRGVAVPAWAALFLAATLAGLAQGVLAPVGAAALGVLAVLAGAARLAPRVGALFTGLAAAWALALALHLVPGFHGPALYDAIRLTPDAAPFTARLGFDKGAAGLVLLVAFCRPAPAARRPVPRAAAGAGATVAVAGATIAAALGLAVGLGLTRIEPHWPAGAPAFLAANLLFTCVAEEAFFRGLVQERIERLGDANGRAAWHVVAVATSTVLFGLAHLGGGAAYALVAGVAGLGYGVMYAATRRIEAAIGVHVLLNAVHFLGFAYPALAR